MSSNHKSDTLDHGSVLRLIEDYTTTIQALQSLISFVTWDTTLEEPLEGSNISIGRKMDTSEANHVSPNTVVTPDAVIQRDAIVGYVVEAKKSLPLEKDHWRSVVDQLLKYDDDLTGWWTDNERLEKCCIVLLIEISRSASFANYLESVLEAEDLEFGSPFSIVEFTRSPEVREFIFIRKNSGDFLPSDLSLRLEEGSKIPIEDVVATYGDLKFYDSEPVLEYTMQILWQVLFNEQRVEVDYDEEERAYLLHVNVENLSHDLQKLYGSSGSESRGVAFPQIQWVQKAMEAFVALNLAQRANPPHDYVVLFRRIQGDVLERFVKHRQGIGKTQAAGSSEQLRLPEDNSSQ